MIVVLILVCLIFLANTATISAVRFPLMLTASPGASPVRLFAVTPQVGTPVRSTGLIRLQASPNKNASNKKFGSLGIFFRKLYHMSYIRLKHLCDNLSISAELQKK